jgi:XTP/dITP diphosphohydrolase
MQLLIGTNNPGKLLQIRGALETCNIICLSPKDVGILADIEETGTSYKENALLKARFYYEKSGLPTLTDDSGLEVAAMPDMLGVKTRRFGKGASVSDAEWIEFFLETMKEVTDKAATFLSVICFIEHSTPVFFESSVKGTITNSVEHAYKPGVPISGCFIPEGETEVYAALEAKGALWKSHRLQSVDKFKKYITM